MKLNFEFIKERNQQIIEIKYLDKIIDFHNACLFTDFYIDMFKQQIVLKWKYYYNYDENIWSAINLVFKKINGLKTETWMQDIPFKENMILEEVLIDADKNTSYWIFNGDFRIKIDSNEIELVFEERL